MEALDTTRDYTYRELLDPAMDVQTKAEADAMTARYVTYAVARHGQTEDEARKVWLANVGYWTGYCDRAVARRVLPLFDTAHPIFGREEPTAEEAFTAGERIGRTASR